MKLLCFFIESANVPPHAAALRGEGAANHANSIQNGPSISEHLTGGGIGPIYSYRNRINRIQPTASQLGREFIQITPSESAGSASQRPASHLSAKDLS